MLITKNKQTYITTKIGINEVESLILQCEYRSISAAQNSGKTVELEH